MDSATALVGEVTKSYDALGFHLSLIVQSLFLVALVEALEAREARSCCNIMQDEKTKMSHPQAVQHVVCRVAAVTAVQRFQEMHIYIAVLVEL